MSRRARAARGAAVLLAAGLAGRTLAAQARPPFPVARDPSGALSAVRAVDLGQICRCSVVMLDSLVRQAPALQVFGLLRQPVALPIRPADAAALKLARRRVVLTSLASLGRRGRDTAFVAVQLIGAAPPGAALRQVAVVATPPNGITVAYQVTLRQQGGTWRVVGVQTVLEP